MSGDLSSGFGWMLNRRYHIVLYSVWDSMWMWVFGGVSKDIRPELLQCSRKVPPYRWADPSSQMGECTLLEGIFFVDMKMFCSVIWTNNTNVCWAMVKWQIVLFDHTFCSCATLDPVSTRMGDCLWTGKPSQYTCNQPTSSTQPSTIRATVKWVSAFGLTNNNKWRCWV